MQNWFFYCGLWTLFFYCLTPTRAAGYLELGILYTYFVFYLKIISKRFFHSVISSIEGTFYYNEDEKRGHKKKSIVYSFVFPQSNSFQTFMHIKIYQIRIKLKYKYKMYFTFTHQSRIHRFKPNIFSKVSIDIDPILFHTCEILQKNSE